MVAGQEVGDADREADDVAAFGLELLGLFGHHHDRTGLGTAHALGELGHRGTSGVGGGRAAGGCRAVTRRAPGSPVILACRPPAPGPAERATTARRGQAARILFHSATRSALAASAASASPSIFTDLMVSPCLTASTTSRPSSTLPNTVCLPSSQSVLMWVMKNWLPLVLGPALAIDSTPRSCLTPLLASSSNL